MLTYTTVKLFTYFSLTLPMLLCQNTPNTSYCSANLTQYMLNASNSLTMGPHFRNFLRSFENVAPGVWRLASIPLEQTLTPNSKNNKNKKPSCR